LAEILKADSNELLVLWLADQLYDVVKDEDMALRAMEAAEEVIISKKKSNKR
jgi:energy-converting hydrogenase A subunit M